MTLASIVRGDIVKYINGNKEIKVTRVFRDKHCGNICICGYYIESGCTLNRIDASKLVRVRKTEEKTEELLTLENAPEGEYVIIRDGLLYQQQMRKHKGEWQYFAIGNRRWFTHSSPLGQGNIQLIPIPRRPQIWDPYIVSEVFHAANREGSTEVFFQASPCNLKTLDMCRAYIAWSEHNAR